MKNKQIVLIFTLIMAVSGLNAQIVKNYQAKYFVHKGDSLPYRFFQPKQSLFEIKRLPLVIFLHGAGERGSDNVKQLTHVAHIFTDSVTQAQYPAYVIAPQCAENHRWVDVDWNLPAHQTPENISNYAGMLMELVEWLSSTLPVDTNRIYITGLSMGGYGTWDLISRFPNKFAAAAPVCGGGDIAKAADIAHIPIWVFHGAKDRVVPVSRSRDMVKAIQTAGGNPKYTEYPNLGHFSWDAAYSEEDFLSWLFSQSKQKR